MNDLFNALAEDDARADVPPHVREAVLRAWDERQGRPAARLWPWARTLAWSAVPAAALIAFGAFWLWPGTPPRHEAPGVEYTEREITAEYALVVDPAVDPNTLSVMRVRLSRGVLASLGVPMEHPEAAGTVEVELVVGEDGVARAIRGITLLPDATTHGSRE
jgi:hypothetical protein